jgi:hypothetical protein
MRRRTISCRLTLFARKLASAEQEVILFDLDLRQPDLARRLGVVELHPARRRPAPRSKLRSQPRAGRPGALKEPAPELLAPDKTRATVAPYTSISDLIAAGLLAPGVELVGTAHGGSTSRTSAAIRSS